MRRAGTVGCDHDARVDAFRRRSCPPHHHTAHGPILDDRALHQRLLVERGARAKRRLEQCGVQRGARKRASARSAAIAAHASRPRRRCDTIMPATGRLSAVASPSPSRASIASAPGLTVSPHSFCRGNRARSMSRTRTPARASTSAAMEPAGPAPQIKTSSARSKTRILTTGRPNDRTTGPLPPALPSTIALFFDPNPRQLQSAASGCAARPTLGMKSRSQSGSGECLVDRRRQEAVAQRERRGHDAGCAAGALRMPDHRLDRRARHAIGAAGRTAGARSATRPRR